MPQAGLIEPGNIDLSHRPRVTNPDGTISTVRSIGVNIDGKEVLIPTVVNGRVVSNQEAIDEYRRTGKHLGKFNDVASSNAFAQQLHESEAAKLPDKVIDIPGVGPVAFPDSMKDTDIEAAAGKLYRDANPSHPEPSASHSWLKSATSWLPTAGGFVGGLVGGVPGAAAGGAAGKGYETTLNHLSEIPGAITDVARNLVSQPAATVRGFMQGATGGAMDAGKDAAIQGGAQAVGPLVGTVAGPVAERLMNSALKPGVKLSLKAAASGEAPEVVKTLLKEGVSVTPGGAAKLERIVSATDDEISNAIAGITGQVNPLKVASRLTPTAKAFAQQVNPTSDLEAISKVGQEFLETHPTDIDLQTAQAIKKGTYKQLPGKAYGELKGAEIESQKALARGLKEEIEDEVGNSLQGIKGKLGLPGGVNISAANARQGAALQARDALARRLVTSQNHNPMGLASLAVSHPATFLAVLMDRNPGVKSLIARGLWGEAGRALKMSPQVVRLAVQTIATDDSTSETPQ